MIVRWFGRSKWTIRFLGLSESKPGAKEKGMVLIQIDGLSHSQLVAALERNEMPFIKNLLDHRGYQIQRHYSGLPSSTPAVQAELFYGIKMGVPAFGFMDRQSGELVRMYEPDAVHRLDEQFQEQGEPLLRGGSSYGDNYTGGAAEVHFSPSDLGWDSLIKQANPAAVGLLALLNVYSLLRTAFLLFVEFFLAIYDCVTGLMEGRNLIKELKFVPTRVAICILLRELVTIGAKVDIARGLPVIHVNYLGYDEQSHRRGPNSRFAHWALKGVDDAVGRVWRSIRTAGKREYEVWIYSDHGQEDSESYAVSQGRFVEEAITEVFEKLWEGSSRGGAGDGRGIALQRARLLGGDKLQRLFPSDGTRETQTEANLTATAVGPLGFVYFGESLDDEDRCRLARGMVEMARIPLVLIPWENDRARAWTLEGEFYLPEDSERLLGGDHPFLQEVTRDFISICHHPNAGQFVISGWRRNAKPMTFPVENGSHGGPGPEETSGFAVLPERISRRWHRKGYLRPSDLRGEVMKRLKAGKDRSRGNGRVGPRG